MTHKTYEQVIGHFIIPTEIKFGSCMYPSKTLSTSWFPRWGRLCKFRMAVIQIHITIYHGFSNPVYPFPYRSSSFFVHLVGPFPMLSMAIFLGLFFSHHHTPYHNNCACEYSPCLSSYFHIGDTF